MTTQASEVSFVIGISLETDLYIDWGDGTENTISDAFYNYPCDVGLSLGFSHSYLGASEHNITITGNILRLDCWQNQLIELDVNRNTELRELRCYYNQLTTLDLSKNTALKYLNCNWNQLIELDVSRNTALKELYCYNNLLTTLDANTTLTDLTCSNNQLTSLDVNKCTMLIYLNCGNNQLTALDVSNNTQLTHLYCPNNQLTALALNYMFRTLRVSPNSQLKYNPYPNPWFWLNIDANPGTSDCDVSIAREKGWWVYPHIYLIE